MGIPAATCAPADCTSSSAPVDTPAFKASSLAFSVLICCSSTYFSIERDSLFQLPTKHQEVQKADRRLEACFSVAANLAPLYFQRPNWHRQYPLDCF